MDSDEDDIYPDNDDVYGTGLKQQGEVTMGDVDDGEEEGEEVEEDDDDDVDFIIDAKDEPSKPAADSTSQPKRPPGSSQTPAPATDPRKASITPSPAIKRERETPLDTRLDSLPPNDRDRPGTDYPARHTSKLDPNGNPVHPATGKPILSTDFDVDFPSESSKPWRKPGADITDYFNYGFDEFTWASYCLKQQQMPKEVKEITQHAEQMKAFVEGIPGGGGGGMPGMPPMPSGPSGGPGGPGDMSGAMPGMPSEAQMQQMFAAMASQGLDPGSMDPGQFMQFMAGPGAAMMGGAPQPPTGPAAGFAGPGGGGGSGFDQGGGPGGGGGGFGGRGRGKGGRRNW
ncbi:hypothetical protein A1O7_08331 [Cladophialophora yegresii CBS 114405]|uniref:Pre-mRNA polyadenylation factor Fip1 domain-containing protein n=1 Tax=Cladophialophora yegresii CBS 114405 TaxID=1182544 RepID=W9WA23_9EURO|nr:uncharacterized protein A1O7_08331 [Cladophialophora yegresii CBS 114405]EXJ55404.1 hypothetical protein A1O7_08331 [Cladophialophora yegresii CBS 114405]